MDITAHLMAAIDKAAGPLDRLADAAEDATAHVAHASRFFRRPLIIGTLIMILGALMLGGYELVSRKHFEAGRFQESNSPASATIRLGGIEYHLERKSFEARLALVQPEEIRKYFVEIGGRKFPVKQAVSVGLGAPRASFRTDAAIRALARLGYQTEEVAP